MQVSERYEQRQMKRLGIKQLIQDSSTRWQHSDEINVLTTKRKPATKVVKERVNSMATSHKTRKWLVVNTVLLAHMFRSCC